MTNGIFCPGYYLRFAQIRLALDDILRLWLGEQGESPLGYCLKFSSRRNLIFPPGR